MLDNAGAFMAEDRRHRRADAMLHGDVGVAHARCNDAHQHFVGARWIEGERLELERLSKLAQDGGSECGARGGRHSGPGVALRRDRALARRLAVRLANHSSSLRRARSSNSASGALACNLASARFHRLAFRCTISLTLSVEIFRSKAPIEEASTSFPKFYWIFLHILS